MAKRLLVLGAGGFLGRSIAHHIAAIDAGDVVLHSHGPDDRAGFPVGAESRMLDLLGCAPGAIADLIDDVAPDAVVNCTGTALGEPEEMTKANVVVVMRLIAELEECKGVHLVHLGSAAEYGIQSAVHPVAETAAPTPRGTYGVTKLKATEQLIRAADDERISVTVLRIFNPVGRFSPPSTLPGSAARKIAAALESGADGINLGALTSWRDYIDTRDIASAVLAASMAAPPASAVFNVGRGEAVESLHLVKTLASIAGFKGEIVESDTRSARSACVDRLCADVRAIKERLGWSAEYSLEDSLTELWSGISTDLERGSWQ